MLTRTALIIAGFASLTSVARAQNVVITTPVAGTTLKVDVPFDANGTYQGPGAFGYIYLQVYDVDLVTVYIAVNGVSTRSPDTNGPGNWTNPVDSNNWSLLRTPTRPSVGLGRTMPFKLQADLYYIRGEAWPPPPTG